MVLSAVPPGRSMEVTVPTTLSVLNGSDTRLPCTFNSCYTVNHKQFSLNWTYQECSNCSEEMVSLNGGGSGGKEARAPKHEAQHSYPYICTGPGPQRTLGRMSDIEGMMSPQLNGPFEAKPPFFMGVGCVPMILTAPCSISCPCYFLLPDTPVPPVPNENH